MEESARVTRAVYECSESGRLAKDFPLRDQMRRAAISIMANIAEGFERGGSAEFTQFSSVAKGSTGELESQLYVALDRDYVSLREFERMQGIAASTKRLIGGMMAYLKASPLRGQKFRQSIDLKPRTRD